jgi:hypothetical protein
MILGPNLTPTRNRILKNQTPGISRSNGGLLIAGLVHGLQRALESDSTSAVSVLCHPGVSHLSSGFTTFGWACGYLNAQMLLSYIREALPNEFREAFGDELPSIRTLQGLIEAGWRNGTPVLHRG